VRDADASSTYCALEIGQSTTIATITAASPVRLVAASTITRLATATQPNNHVTTTYSLLPRSTNRHACHVASMVRVLVAASDGAWCADDQARVPRFEPLALGAHRHVMPRPRRARRMPNSTRSANL
jgi:hypothetical protein